MKSPSATGKTTKHWMFGSSSSTTETDFSCEFSISERTTNDDDNNNKIVGFDQVTVIEIGMVLGDNPGCTSGGPPVQLGSKVLSNTTCSIDDHEQVKANSSLSRGTTSRTSTRRHNKRRLLSPIPAHQRSHLMLHAGHTMKEICAATIAVQEYQKLRQESIEFYEQNCTIGQRITSFLKRSAILDNKKKTKSLPSNRTTPSSSRMFLKGERRVAFQSMMRRSATTTPPRRISV